MKFTRNLFQEAFHALSVNRAMAFTFVAAQLALQILEEKLGNSGNVAQLILFSILAICIHQAVIKPDFSVPNFTQKSMMWAYGWRLIVMLILCGVVGYLLASLVPLPADAKYVFFALAIVVIVILYVLVLCVYGTALPAVAVGGDTGFSIATARGAKTFGYSASRLFFCCGLLFIAEFALMYYLLGKFEAADAKVLGGPMGVNVTPLIFGIITSLFGLLNTALASTILSRAYLIGEAKINGTAS